MPGKTKLEDIDARDIQHPDHQPDRDHGHHNVADPFLDGFRFGAIGHTILLPRFWPLRRFEYHLCNCFREICIQRV